MIAAAVPLAIADGGLVRADGGQGSDDGVSRGCRGEEDVAGHGRQAGVGVMTAAMVVFRRLALNGPDWMTRTGAALGGLAAARLAEIGRPDAAALDNRSSCGPGGCGCACRESHPRR